MLPLNPTGILTPDRPVRSIDMRCTDCAYSTVWQMTAVSTDTCESYLGKCQVARRMRIPHSLSAQFAAVVQAALWLRRHDLVIEPYSLHAINPKQTNTSGYRKTYKKLLQTVVC